MALFESQVKNDKAYQEHMVFQLLDSLINSHYMMSSDYVDSLDVGMEPEEDSQYWAAPYVRKVFEEIVMSKRPDVAEYMRSHTEMEL